jgi:hypothetical protein
MVFKSPISTGIRFQEQIEHAEEDGQRQVVHPEDEQSQEDCDELCEKEQNSQILLFFDLQWATPMSVRNKAHAA